MFWSVLCILGRYKFIIISNKMCTLVKMHYMMYLCLVWYTCEQAIFLNTWWILSYLWIKNVMLKKYNVWYKMYKNLLTIYIKGTHLWDVVTCNEIWPVLRLKNWNFDQKVLYHKNCVVSPFFIRLSCFDVEMTILSFVCFTLNG